MARVTWRNNDFITLKLREDLFSIGMFKISPYMWIFDYFRQDDDFSKVDLKSLKPLFCVIVASLVNSRLGVKRIKPPADCFEIFPIPRNWIRPILNSDNWVPGELPWKGGSLIDLDPTIGTLKSTIKKYELKVAEDRDLIESSELTNMWGEKDLGDRLVRFYDTGINRDDLKFEIFPGLWNDREKLRPLTRRLPVPMR